LFNPDGTFTSVTGPKFEVGSTEAQANRDFQRIKFGDFNGDGITDVLRINGWNSNSHSSVHLFDTHGGYVSVLGPKLGVGGTDKSANRDLRRVHLGDFNGDGITDVLRVDGWN